MKPTFNFDKDIVAHLGSVHVAYGNTDSAEGRGEQYILGAFLRYDEAVAAGRGQYVMGSDCPTAIIPALIFTEAEEKSWCVPVEHILPLYARAIDMERIELREQALAKLSPAERRALGVG